MNLNILDLILIVFLIGSLMLGFKRGFVWQFIKLVSFVAAYFVAFWYYRQLAPVVAEWIPFPDLSENVYFSFFDASTKLESIFYSSVSFGLLFFATRLLLNLAGHFFHGIASLPVLSFFNRWLGSILSLLEVSLIVVLLINIAVYLPFAVVQESLAKSQISQYVLERSPFLTEHLQGLWDKYKEDLPSRPEKKETEFQEKI